MLIDIVLIFSSDISEPYADSSSDISEPYPSMPIIAH